MTVSPKDLEFPLSILVAVAENGVMGYKDRLPWHISSDLKRFRKLTLNHPIIMGRKTFESIGKALKKRKNIVLTSKRNLASCDVFPASSLEEALELARQENPKEVFIIGGRQIYSLFLPFCQKLYFTLVHASPKGDVLFPEIDWNQWQLVSKEFHPKGPKDDYDCSYYIYKRLNS